MNCFASASRSNVASGVEAQPPATRAAAARNNRPRAAAARTGRITSRSRSGNEPAACDDIAPASLVHQPELRSDGLDASRRGDALLHEIDPARLALQRYLSEVSEEPGYGVLPGGGFPAIVSAGVRRDLPGVAQHDRCRTIVEIRLRPCDVDHRLVGNRQELQGVDLFGRRGYLNATCQQCCNQQVSPHRTLLPDGWCAVYGRLAILNSGGVPELWRLPIQPRLMESKKALLHPSHRVEEVRVALRRPDLVEQKLGRFQLVLRVEELAQHPDLLQHVLLDEQLLAPGAGLVDVDRREDALLVH